MTNILEAPSLTIGEKAIKKKTICRSGTLEKYWFNNPRSCIKHGSANDPNVPFFKKINT